MKLVFASDSFKGTLSSEQTVELLTKAAHEVFGPCETFGVPVADGGEGTVDCFVSALGAVPVHTDVTGALGDRTDAVYAVLGDTAFIEMSAAAGLPSVGDRKDPGITTTYGVGEMIRDAVSGGCRKILLGLGGSATNDAGCGCAAALGTVFHDAEGKEFVPTGDTLALISEYDNSKTGELLCGVSVTAICDVRNPLYGPQGASFVFAPQKGADEQKVIQR